MCFNYYFFWSKIMLLNEKKTTGSCNLKLRNNNKIMCNLSSTATTSLLAQFVVLKVLRMHPIKVKWLTSLTPRLSLTCLSAFLSSTRYLTMSRWPSPAAKWRGTFWWREGSNLFVTTHSEVNRSKVSARLGIRQLREIHTYNNQWPWIKVHN